MRGATYSWGTPAFWAMTRRVEKAFEPPCQACISYILLSFFSFLGASLQVCDDGAAAKESLRAVGYDGLPAETFLFFWRTFVNGEMLLQRSIGINTFAMPNPWKPGSSSW